MRKRSHICMILLIGMSFSVAAFSQPPTVAKDVGVTKVEKISDLKNVVELNFVAPHDLLVYAIDAAVNNSAFAAYVSDQNSKTILSTANPVISDDHPVRRFTETSYNSLQKEDPGSAVKQAKIYLKNCSIKQCFSGAVAAA